MGREGRRRAPGTWHLAYRRGVKSHHLYLDEKGAALWDGDEGFRRRVKVGGQFVADDCGLPLVLRARKKTLEGDDRVLIIFYPRPAIRPR